MGATIENLEQNVEVSIDLFADFAHRAKQGDTAGSELLKKCAVYLTETSELLHKAYKQMGEEINGVGYKRMNIILSGSSVEFLQQLNLSQFKPSKRPNIALEVLYS